MEKGRGMTVFHLLVCAIPNKSVTFAAGMASRLFPFPCGAFARVSGGGGIIRGRRYGGNP